jgi:hypothetical protein
MKEMTKMRDPKPVTSEEDLAFLQRNKISIIKKVGQARYDRMVKALEDHIKRTRKT